MALDYNRSKPLTLNIRLSEDSRAKLEDLAAGMEIGMSGVVRLAVRELWERRFPKKEKR